MLPMIGRNAWAQESEPAWRWTPPIGWPGRTPGDGFFIKHGYACENVAFYAGGWHTGENWYALDDADTAGAEIYAIADGEIVFAGFDYPGPVVIIRHEDDLYSQYGHLDYVLDIDSGPVRRGQRIGTVLNRTDGRSPSHLHFEVRRFLTTPEVNGPNPRYTFTCGPNCPPGPGYWPIDAPEHPSAMGWLFPVHAMAEMAFPDGVPEGIDVLVAEGARETVPVFSTPGGEEIGELALTPGDRYVLHGIETGAPDSEGTSAEAYQLRYLIAVPDNDAPVWVDALWPSDEVLGSDGRPSSVRFDLLPG
ncbi:MAG TPA: M23 family metallopeptidase [Thermomicrobiales bacterium]|nr:M23 family metallopeptidase [Thermomicrobiales bacterium]